MGTGIQLNRQTTVETTVIANGAAVSAAVAGDGKVGGIFILPASFENTTVGFEVSADNSTFVDLYENSGLGHVTSTLIGMTVASSRAYKLPDELAFAAFWRFKGTGNETGAATITIMRGG